MTSKNASGNASQKRYPAELKERAVRMVSELQAQDPNDHGVISRVARQLGIGSERTNETSLRRTQADTGDREMSGARVNDTRCPCDGRAPCHARDDGIRRLPEGTETVPFEVLLSDIARGPRNAEAPPLTPSDRPPAPTRRGSGPAPARRSAGSPSLAAPRMLGCWRGPASCSPGRPPWATPSSCKWSAAGRTRFPPAQRAGRQCSTSWTTL